MSLDGLNGDDRRMRTPIERSRRLLATWIGLAFVAGIASAAGGVETRGETVAAGSAAGASASQSDTSLRPATTAPEATSTTAPLPTTIPVAETTVPPTTSPPTVPETTTTVPAAPVPPVTEPEPASPGIEVSFGPEVYESNGQPYIRLRGTGCTGPDHVEGGSDFIWNYPLQPGQYGVSYVYATLDGQWLIRMEPVNSHPGTGEWEVAIPPIGGPGEFLVYTTCVNAASVIEPPEGPTSWSAPVFEYPAEHVVMPT